MGDLDIGMAMVAARIASSETERDQAARTREGAGAPNRRPPGEAKWRSSPLPGVKLEAIKGELFLVPSGESTRRKRGRGWTLSREDGSVVLIDTGEIVRQQKGKE